MIFGKIKTDEQVFTGDMLRIDASKTFVSPDKTIAPTNGLQISVDSGVSWLDITNKKYVDWAFTTSGTKTITLRVTTTSSDTQDFTKDVVVLDITTQGLFSKDDDLYKYEPDIDSLLPKKWSSWNLIHLEAQKQIVQWLDFKGIRRSDGTTYTASDILDKKQVREWSALLVLSLIYQGNSNQTGDIFSSKSTLYKNLAEVQMNLSHIELTGQPYNETNNNTTNLRVVELVRR